METWNRKASLLGCLLYFWWVVEVFVFFDFGLYFEMIMVAE